MRGWPQQETGEICSFIDMLLTKLKPPELILDEGGYRTALRGPDDPRAHPSGPRWLRYIGVRSRKLVRYVG